MIKNYRLEINSRALRIAVWAVMLSNFLRGMNWAQRAEKAKITCVSLSIFFVYRDLY